MFVTTLQAALDHAHRDRLPPTPREQVDLAAARVAALQQALQIVNLYRGSVQTGLTFLHSALERSVAEFDGARLAATTFYTDKFED